MKQTVSASEKRNIPSTEGAGRNKLRRSATLHLAGIPWFRILESSGGLGINLCGYPLGKIHNKKSCPIGQLFQKYFDLFYCFTIVLLLI
jgi:hypothetical protein